MESTTTTNKLEKINYNFFPALIFLTLSIFATIIFGYKGLILSVFGALALIITPLIYNKPGIFLIFSLCIYPFTRILPLDDKFIITGSLYVLSIPCIFWVMKKYFKAVSGNSLYLWALLAYTGVIFLNILRPGTDIVNYLKEFGRVIFALFMILSVYNYVNNDPLRLEKLIRYFSYVMNLIALVAFGQYFTKIGGLYNEGFYRIRGTFFNFNEYGFVISLFICFALYILLTSENIRQRFYWTATIIINLMALMGTFSKTSIINTALVFLIMSLFLPKKRIIQIFTSIAVIITLLMSFLVMTGTINTLVARFTDTGSLQWRFGIWKILYDQMLAGNIILGQGINASKDLLQHIMPVGESFAPHNVYLETAYNFGLVGLIPFVLIFILILTQGFSIFFDKHIANKQNRIIGVSIITITSITMIQNFVSNAFYDRAANVFFWVLLTLLVCKYRSILIKDR